MNLVSIFTFASLFGLSIAGDCAVNVEITDIIPEIICSGDTVTLQSSSGFYSYSWYPVVGNLKDITVSPTDTTTYTVTGADANGCQSSDVIVVTVNPAPTVGGGDDQTICSGDSVTLSGSGAETYIWNNGIADNVAFFPTVTTTYTVTGTDANGCDSSDDIVVTVNPCPDDVRSSHSFSLPSDCGAMKTAWQNHCPCSQY